MTRDYWTDFNGYVRTTGRSSCEPEKDMTDIDALAQEIRRVDGSNQLGAGALAEALVPFIAALSTQQGNEPVAWRCKDYADGWMLYQFRENAEAYQKETGCLMEPLFAAPPSPNSAADELARLRGERDMYRDALAELCGEMVVCESERKALRKALELAQGRLHWAANAEPGVKTTYGRELVRSWAKEAAAITRQKEAE